MAHEGEEKFGEKRPPRKDEWGNDFRTFQLHDMKIEKKCTDECKDHVTMTYSIEMDVVACGQMEAIMLTMQGQPLPTKKDWVTVTRVLSSYN
jgi:hypothetical protein